MAQKHPETVALTAKTGHTWSYSRDPHESYYESRSIGLFGSLKGDPGAENKELVVGIEIEGTAKAYKLEELRSNSQIKDKVGKTDITLEFDKETDNLTVMGQNGKSVGHMVLYWFVWKNIYPEAQVYQDTGGLFCQSITNSSDLL